MRFNREILSSALREMDAENTTRAALLSERCQKIYAQIPRICEIDRLLSQTVTAVLHTALQKGTDPTEAIAQLQKKNLDLQAERRQLLIQHSYPPDYLDAAPLCSICSDTGYIGTEPCDCLKKRYAAHLIKELSITLPIGEQNFEQFRLDYYSTTADSRLKVSPRDNMIYNRDLCRQYADTFSLHSDNLLLYGSTGLGKTFLSSCIAKVVSQHGFSVAYDTSICIFSSYESVKFKSPDFTDALRRIRKYEQCDLLIIDDLGTEMVTAFTISTLYGLLANRLMHRRPTIVNTNLLPMHLEKRYSPAIASRLTGDFVPLRFFGTDIRTAKRREEQRSNKKNNHIS